LDKILDKLENVSPLNNPSPKNSTPKQQQFLENLQKLMDRAQKLRDQIQKIQDEINDNDHKLKEVVQPISELKEREVGTPEIKHIRDVLLQMLNDIQAQLEELNALDDDMDRLL
jgi:uncharacterized coiled-coil DUF342 family protein